jgi:hypothetical protein
VKASQVKIVPKNDIKFDQENVKIIRPVKLQYHEPDSSFSLTNFFSNFHDFMGGNLNIRRRGEIPEDGKDASLSAHGINGLSKVSQPTVQQVQLPHSSEKFNVVGPFREPPPGASALTPDVVQYPPRPSDSFEGTFLPSYMNPSLPYSGTSAPQTVPVHNDQHPSTASGEGSPTAEGQELFTYGFSGGHRGSPFDYSSDRTSSYAVNYLHKSDEDLGPLGKYDKHDTSMVRSTVFNDSDSSGAIPMNGNGTKMEGNIDISKSASGLIEMTSSMPVTTSVSPVTPMKITEFNPYAGRKPQHMIDGVSGVAQRVADPPTTYGGWSAMVIPVPVPRRDAGATSDADALTSSGMRKTPRAFVDQDIITKESLGLTARDSTDGADIVVGRSVEMPRRPTSSKGLSYSTQLKIDGPDDVASYHL